MKYEIHRFNIDMEKDQDKLKQILNNLKGEVVEIIPNIKPTFKLMGQQQKLTFCLLLRR